ncbi:MAG: AsmA family protein [Roseococcus sp.]|nr:AsmA family protein [Roseococcus sp.]
MRRALILAAGLLLALPLAALLGLLLLFDPDRFRPEAERAAARALGRELVIAGGLSWAPGLTPRFGAARILLHGADGAPALTLARAELRLALAPLLSGRVEVAELRLEEGVLRLDPAAWAPPAAPPPGAAPAPAAPGAGAPLALAIRRITLHNWRLTLGGEALELPALRADAPTPGAPLALAGEARWRGLSLALSGEAAPPARVHLRAAAEGAALAVEATPGSARLRLDLPEPGRFSALAGRPLEALGPVQAEAEARRGPAGWAAGALMLRAAPAGGRLLLTGAGEGVWRAELALPALAPLAPLAGRALPPVTGIEGRATLALAGDRRLALRELLLASSAGDLAGEVTFALAPRPGLSGSLRSGRLDLAALRPPPAPAAAATMPAPAPAPAAPPRLIPDLPLDLSALRGFDADLAFRLARVEDGPRVLTEVEGRFLNEAGRARLDPLRLALPGGRLALRAAADATRPVPAVQVTGGGQGLDLAAFLRGLGAEAPSDGRADLAFDLRGEGAGTRALAASLAGGFGLAVIDGALGGGLARSLSQLSPQLAQGVALSCLALRGEAEGGVLRLSTVFLDGAAGRIGGEGAIRLADETLALRLLADLRLGGVRLRAPVPVTGTLAQPRLEGAGLLAGALGGVALPPLPDCATALRAARGGIEGPLPAPRAAPDPAAPLPGADLLRGLLGR